MKKRVQMSFFDELKRRRVIRMAVLYVASAYFVLEAAGLFINLLDLPEEIGPALFVLLLIGFPIALVLSWFYAVTPAGIERESEADSASIDDSFRSRKFDVIVISILAAAVLMFALGHFLDN